MSKEVGAAPTGEEQSASAGADFISAFLFAVLLTITCGVAVASGTPWGLTSGPLSVKAVAFTHMGLLLAVPVGLAAWSVLRMSHPMYRFASPAVMLFVFAAAMLAGKQLNHTDQGGIRLFDVLIIYLTSCLFFQCVKVWWGWRLGPTYRGDRSVRLPHLFMWTAIAGIGFAVISWLRPTVDEFLPTNTWIADVMIGLLGGTLATAALGFVLDEVRRLRYAGFLATVLVGVIALLAWLTRLSDTMVEELAATIAPCVFVVLLGWCFAVFRGFGYTLVHRRSRPREQIRVMAAAIGLVGCLALSAYSWVAIGSLAESRADKAFEASWKPLGIRPMRQDDKVVGVLFGAAVPMTQRAVSHLDGQPVRFVNIVNDTPEPGSLRKLASMSTLERVHLEGGKITKAHLEELYDAQHLKGVTLRAVSGLNDSDIDELRQSLPHCKVDVR